MALKLDDLSKIPPRQKALVAVLLSALVLVGYYYLYYQDASRKVATLQTQLNSLRAKITEQEAVARDLQAFRAEVQRLEAQLSVLLE
ncbi:MAG: type II secretion system protein GspM, partial [Verrucomicrobiota bacterium]